MNSNRRTLVKNKDYILDIAQDWPVVPKKNLFTLPVENFDKRKLSVNTKKKYDYFMPSNIPVYISPINYNMKDQIPDFEEKNRGRPETTLILSMKNNYFFNESGLISQNSLTSSQDIQYYPPTLNVFLTYAKHRNVIDALKEIENFVYESYVFKKISDLDPSDKNFLPIYVTNEETKDKGVSIYPIILFKNYTNKETKEIQQEVTTTVTRLNKDMSVETENINIFSLRGENMSGSMDLTFTARIKKDKDNDKVTGIKFETHLSHLFIYEKPS